MENRSTVRMGALALVMCLHAPANDALAGPCEAGWVEEFTSGSMLGHFAFGIPFVGEPEAFAVFDDGRGDAFYIGGMVHVVGGVRNVVVVRWDGEHWEGIGEPLVGTSPVSQRRVHALLPFDDGTGQKLYAGGNFSIAGGGEFDAIARWDGRTWEQVGDEIAGQVYALAEFDEGSGRSLYAGGFFTIPGGPVPTSVARWDGEQWLPVGNGFDDGVYALTVYPADGEPSLFAGGTFTQADGQPRGGIARWDGLLWQPVGNAQVLNGWIRCFEIYDEDGERGSGPSLFAGGWFTEIAGIEAEWLARWDGSSWSAVESSGEGVSGRVNDLVVFPDGDQDTLIAVGNWYFAGGVFSPAAARWNGQAWSALEGGTLFYSQNITPYVTGIGVAPESRGPTLWMGGAIQRGGDVRTNCLARWHDGRWLVPGNGLDDETFVVHESTVGSERRAYVGGTFVRAGDLTVRNVAAWDGEEWSDVAGGINGPVWSLSDFSSNAGDLLIAAGAFSEAGGVPCAGIAAWDGVSWAPLGDGFNSSVYATAVAEESGKKALYAAGAFFTADGSPASRIARWDGEQWSPLGAGLNTTAFSLCAGDIGEGSSVYAGGQFTQAGGLPALRVARWDGAAWHPLGSGANSVVYALAISDVGGESALYAGGAFTQAGGGAASRVARWNGAQWTPLGDGLNGIVYALASFDDGDGPALYAAGVFTAAGGVQAWGLARWDGVAWAPAGDIARDHDLRAGTGRALAVSRSGPTQSLLLAGEFAAVGGVSAGNIARYVGCAPVPTCAGDIDGDGLVDMTDLQIVLSDFGCNPPPGPACPGDGDGDGDTDTTDLNMVLSTIGRNCP